jgi:hypothetical protein
MNRFIALLHVLKILLKLKTIINQLRTLRICAYIKLLNGNETAQMHENKNS